VIEPNGLPQIRRVTEQLADFAWLTAVYVGTAVPRGCALLQADAPAIPLPDSRMWFYVLYWMISRFVQSTADNGVAGVYTATVPARLSRVSAALAQPALQPLLDVRRLSYAAILQTTDEGCACL